MLQSYRVNVYSAYNWCRRSASYFCGLQSWCLSLIRCHDDTLYSRIWTCFCSLHWWFLCYTMWLCHTNNTLIPYIFYHAVTVDKHSMPAITLYLLFPWSLPLLFINTASQTTPQCALHDYYVSEWWSICTGRYIKVYVDSGGNVKSTHILIHYDLYFQYHSHAVPVARDAAKLSSQCLQRIQLMQTQCFLFLWATEQMLISHTMSWWHIILSDLDGFLFIALVIPMLYHVIMPYQQRDHSLHILPCRHCWHALDACNHTLSLFPLISPSAFFKHCF